MSASINKILLLCFAAALLSPIGVDIYIALIPEISRTYQVNAEYALSTFIFGMGLGSLFSGALYDCFGGRKTLLMCISVLLLSLVLTLVTDSFAALMVNRFFQGVAISGISLSGLSIVKDNLPQKDVGTTYAKINGVMNLIPAIFPPISIFLLTATGEWKSAFALFFVIGCLLFVFTLMCFTKDSLQWHPAKFTGFKSMFKLSDFTRHFENDMFKRHFALPVVSLAIIFMMCAFLPKLFVNTYGWTIHEFSMYFGFNGVIMFFTGLCSGVLFARFGASFVLRAGLCVSFVAALCLLVMTYLQSPVGALVSISMYCVSFILIISSSHALSLSTIGDGTGKANSIISVLQMFFGALLSAVSVIFSGTLVLYVFCFFVFLLFIQGTLFTWRYKV